MSTTILTNRSTIAIRGAGGVASVSKEVSSDISCATTSPPPPPQLYFHMPMQGFGTYLLNVPDAEAGCLAALEVGYRHIDTAEFYDNHEGVAAAIEKSGVKREEIFLVDKVSPGGLFGQKQTTYEGVKEIFARHLSRLSTTYLDLYLLHHAYAKEERLNQYQALLDLQKEGLLRSVGVSNWNISHLEEIRCAGLPLPSVNQIEIHPLCTQSELVAYHVANDIATVAYSSLAPLASWRAKEGQASAKDKAPVEQPSLVKALSEKYACSESQLLLRWALQHGYAILPKSVNRDRIAENFDLYRIEICSEDIKAMDALDANTPLAWPIGNPLHAP